MNILTYVSKLNQKTIILGGKYVNTFIILLIKILNRYIFLNIEHIMNIR